MRDRCNNDIVEDVTLSGLLFAFDKLACFRVSNLVAVCWRSESDDVRLHSARTFRSHLTHNIDAPFDIEYIYLLRINVHVQPVAGQSPGALESSPPPVVHPFFCAVATVPVRTRIRVKYRIISSEELHFFPF